MLRQLKVTECQCWILFPLIETWQLISAVTLQDENQCFPGKWDDHFWLMIELNWKDHMYIVCVCFFFIWYAFPFEKHKALEIRFVCEPLKKA